MRSMKFIRRKIKKLWTFTSVLNFVTGRKNDVNIETSNEAIRNKLPFSVLLCMRVYYVGNTYSDVYEIEFIDV